jgi:periplasmic divalent cation tolerance protein
MPDAIQIITTTPDKELAQRIARALVEQRLAACVQIAGPVESIYRWQGQIESASEWQCWIKTTTARYPDVERTIRELHSYTVPEILATPITAGNPDYLKWLAECVTDT